MAWFDTQTQSYMEYKKNTKIFVVMNMFSGFGACGLQP